MLKIMIVEDEALIRENMAESIDWEIFGCQVSSIAENGVIALEKAQGDMPDIVICDIMMPEMDGLTLSEKLVGLKPDIKIILLTGYKEFDFVRKALTIGAFDYILKPTNPDELQEIVQRAVNEIYEKRGISPDTLDDTTNKRYIQTIMQTQTYVQDHYAEKITLEMMADKCFMSQWYFSKLFKKITGSNFIEYLTEVRIGKAKEIIRSFPELKNYEVGQRVGFPNTQYFNRIFKKATGQTPSEFRSGKP